MAVLGSEEDLTRGWRMLAFEEEFAAYVGAKYAVACSSGTAALWLACRVTDAFKVPAITFAATRNAVMPVDQVSIVDVNAKSGLSAITNEPSLLLVAYAGQMPDGGCEVLDAAHALGSTMPEGGRVGSCNGATATCFSFHPTKTITTGEGGMVTTNDWKLAQEMRRLRDNGVVRSKEDPPGYYDNEGFGLNFHMSEIAAALGRSQLKRIDAILACRRGLAYRYLLALPTSVRTVIGDSASVERNACHIFPVLIDFEALGIPRTKVMYELMRRGIETNVHYVPLKRGLPGAEEFYRRELTLPLHCGMTLEDVDHVCNALREVLDG